MAENSFLSEVTTINLSATSGFALRAHFNPDHYNFSLFKLHEIRVPNVIRDFSRIRQSEFLAGRILAKEILKRLGNPGQEVKIGAGGMPIWPTQISGSISHTKSFVCCIAIEGNIIPIGIDCEDIMSSEVAASISDYVISKSEAAIIKEVGLDFRQALTIFFSAKESFFKAVFQIFGKYIDFLDVEVVKIDQPSRKVFLSASSKAKRDNKKLPALEAEYLIHEDVVITAICSAPYSTV